MLLQGHLAGWPVICLLHVVEGREAFLPVVFADAVLPPVSGGLELAAVYPFPYGLGADLDRCGELLDGVLLFMWHELDSWEYIDNVETGEGRFCRVGRLKFH